MTPGRKKYKGNIKRMLSWSWTHQTLENLKEAGAVSVALCRTYCAILKLLDVDWKVEMSHVCQITKGFRHAISNEQRINIGFRLLQHICFSIYDSRIVITISGRNKIIFLPVPGAESGADSLCVAQKIIQQTLSSWNLYFMLIALWERKLACWWWYTHVDAFWYNSGLQWCWTVMNGVLTIWV